MNSKSSNKEQSQQRNLLNPEPTTSPQASLSSPDTPQNQKFININRTRVRVNRENLTTVQQNLKRSLTTLGFSETFRKLDAISTKVTNQNESFEIDWHTASILESTLHNITEAEQQPPAMQNLENTNQQLLEAIQQLTIQNNTMQENMRAMEARLNQLGRQNFARQQNPQRRNSPLVQSSDDEDMVRERAQRQNPHHVLHQNEDYETMWQFILENRSSKRLCARDVVEIKNLASIMQESNVTPNNAINTIKNNIRMYYTVIQYGWTTALKIKNAWHQQEAGLAVPPINIIQLPNYSFPRQTYQQPYQLAQPLAQPHYAPRPATRGRGRGRGQRTRRPNY